jgi:hypothetical protein
MKKIQNKIQTLEDFDKLMKILSDRVKENKPISDNPMLDGMIIGFMFSTYKFSRDLILDTFNNQHILDGTLQKLENIAIWLSDNEEEIIKLLCKK